MRGGTDFEPLTVERWAGRLLRESTATIVGFVFLAALFRTGFARYMNPVGLEAAATLPDPVTEYRGGTVLSPILARLLSVSSLSTWTQLHAVLTVGLGALIVWLIWRRFDLREQRLFVVVAVGASSLPVVSLMHVGHYDVWFLAGGALVALSRSTFGAAVGGVLMGLTNTEQGIVALVALIAVSAIVDRPFARRTSAPLVAVIACAAAVRGWYAVTDTPSAGRSDEFTKVAGQSIDNFVQSLPIQVYSWFSAAWLVMVSVARPRLVVMAGFTLPVAVTALTLDGTRVFVAVSTPVFLFLIVRAADTLGRGTIERLTCWTLIIMCVTPGLSTFSHGLVEIPLLWLPRGWSPF